MELFWISLCSSLSWTQTTTRQASSGRVSVERSYQASMRQRWRISSVLGIASMSATVLAKPRGPAEVNSIAM